MTVEDLKNALPAYAKDLKLNLSSLLQEASLTEQQRAGTFVASAMAAGHALTIGAIAETFRPKMSAEAFDAARAAAAIMAMNNVYYRFTHLVSATEYRNLPARLRMNVIGNPGVDKVDFELWALAVSAINGCGACVNSHERELRKHGLGVEAVQAAVRIAAVVKAVASTLAGEDAVNKTQALAA